ncbi:hypothetical protein FKP32DRAFT_322476 [Trametes sanguinea]|nr:hypothetical protein FKP32DRAFT_322476 [Trametes sanguinea]
MDPLLLFLVLGVALLVHAIRRYRASRYLRKIRGPPSPSLLMGHNELRSSQFEVGTLDKEYMQEYGTVWRIKTCFSVRRPLRWRSCTYHLSAAELF